MALTFNLPSQIVVQTAAQWAVDATVYSNKRILVTSDEYYGSTDQRKFKIADGTQTWSNLDYMPISQTLAEVLANGNLTNEIPIQSNDLSTLLFVSNGYSQLEVNGNRKATKLNLTDLEAYLEYLNTLNNKTGKVTVNETKIEILHSDLIDLNATNINIPQSTASRIVETDASKNLTFAAKNTAYNLNLGTTAGTVLEGNRITQVITNGVTDEIPSVDAVYDAFASIRNVYQIITGTLAPADSTTYYSNATADTTANFSTNIAVYQCQIPITGTIKECSIVVFNNNNPTTEASTLYLRNLTTSTDYQLSNAVTFDATNGFWKPLTLTTGLSIPVVAGSNYNIKLVTPAWVTNPTLIRIAVNLSISA